MIRLATLFRAHLALALLLCASEARAYTYFDCHDPASKTTKNPNDGLKWPAGTSTVFYANNADFDRGPEESSSRLPNTYKSALEWAVAEWELAPQNLSSFIRYDISGAPERGNRRNEISFNNAACRAGCTYYYGNCSLKMTETDIQFQRVTWTTSFLKIKHKPYVPVKWPDFRAVALHELGHAFGLAHTATTYNLMGNAFTHSHTNGELSVPYIGADDVAGWLALYGRRSYGRPELGVSHWRFTSPNPDDTEYALHRFVSVLDSSGNKIPHTQHPNGAERLYTLRRGQVVMPEFTLESTGTPLPSTFETRYYLSTDDNIDSLDRLLAIYSGQSVEDAVVTYYRRNVTIPTNAPTNQIMHLGIIVDTRNQLSESHDDPFGNTTPSAYTGNATYIPITIVP